MLLMIDNYDSFTYNLVQYFGELGADVNVYRNDAITLEQIAAWKPERIVISPGPCTPKEAGMKLLHPPRRPEWTPFMLETFSLRRYREWLPFLSTVDAAYWNTELQP